MKKVLSGLFLFTTLLTACNNEAENNDPVDSLEARKDSLVQNVDSTADAKRDSISAWEERQKEKFDSTLQKRIDSTKNSN
jgi:gas vesicle protein